MSLAATTYLDPTDADIAMLLNEGIFEYTSGGTGSEDSMDYEVDNAASNEYEQIALNLAPSEVNSSDRMPTIADLTLAERTTKYLEKLYCMLEQCPESIAAWTPNGTSFVVFNSEDLEKTMLPQYFKPIKFESFARQLNSYGFRKAKYNVHNKVVFEFSHSKFIRGKSQELQMIKRRQRVKRASPVTKSTSEPVTQVVDGLDVQKTLVELMSFVRSLQSELTDTKALVQDLLNKKSIPI